MIRRTAVRALLVSEPGERVLLIKIRVPDSGNEIWLAPGGGVETGESDAVALRREIREETGALVQVAGDPVWRRRHAFVYRGEEYDQSEVFYLIRVSQFEPTGAYNPASQEVEITQAYRWWSIDEMRASDDVFVPLTMADALQRLLTGPLPPQPLDVGV